MIMNYEKCFIIILRVLVRYVVTLNGAELRLCLEESRLLMP